MPLLTRPPRKLLLFLGVPVLLAAILVGAALYDTHRSRHAWEKHRAAAIARGVEYDLTRFAPAPLPDEENFAATPFFRELFAADETTRKEMTERLKLHPAKEGAPLPPDDWFKGNRFDPAAWQAYLGTSDLHEALRPHEALLEEISHAARRPSAVFPLEYNQLGALALPHGMPLLHLGRLYWLRGQLALAANAPKQAFEDLQTLLRLASHAGDHDPLLFASLIQTNLFSQAMHLYWQGLVSRQWSDAELLQVQERLEKADFLSRGQKVYQAERAAYINQVALLVDSLPEAEVRTPAYYEIYHDMKGYLPFKGWLYQSLLQGDRFFEASLLPLLDPAAHRVDAAKEQRIREDLEALRKKPHASHLFILYSFRPLLDVTRFSAYAQTLADLGTVATALERHRLRLGSYPEALTELAPADLQTVPHDPVTGEPLHYRRTGDGRFLLYSVGWNGTDDSGESQLAEDQRPLVEIPGGDWAWPMSNKNSESES